MVFYKLFSVVSYFEETSLAWKRGVVKTPIHVNKMYLFQQNSVLWKYKNMVSYLNKTSVSNQSHKHISYTSNMICLIQSWSHFDESSSSAKSLVIPTGTRILAASN